MVTTLSCHKIRKFCHFRRYSSWSMKKDPDLETALSRNRRWIVNNQIKNIILRYPSRIVDIQDLQKKFKTLDCQGKALNWVKKYSYCFETFLHNGKNYCQLTKQMTSLVEEEEHVRDLQEPIIVQRLAKLLMMSTRHRLNVVKLNELKRSFGFSDDYLIRVLPKLPETFRLINYSGRRTSMEIELLSWKEEWGVSAIEAAAKKENVEPRFKCCLPATWVKSIEKFEEFNRSKYISPYCSEEVLSEEAMEKRTVGRMHELLSLTLWKKVSIQKLGHFRKELGLPEKPNELLLKHPGIFYVSNKYQIYTVLLREAYRGSELAEKDPLVVVKEKFGDLMQCGLHERNRRNYLANMEKKRKKGMIESVVGKKDESDEPLGESEGIVNPEERKRFYRALLGDDF